MLTDMRAAYRKGRLASDEKYNEKMIRKALRKAGPEAQVLVATRVSVLNRNILLRHGWTQADRSSIYVGGTGASWTDSYTMTIPRDKALATLAGR